MTYQLGNLCAALNLPLQTAIADHYDKQYGIGIALVIAPVLVLTAVFTMLGPENKGARFGQIGEPTREVRSSLAVGPA